jgi:hypothetical protein
MGVSGAVPITGSRWQLLRLASRNTAACLFGCALGDLGTIWVCQLAGVTWPVWLIMSLAMVNGIATSFTLETILLVRIMQLREAVRTAFGMSLLSMLGMEVAMNAVDILLTGGARLTWWVIPPMLAAGFLVPLPYNYWRLRVLGKSCH